MYPVYAQPQPAAVYAPSQYTQQYPSTTYPTHIQYTASTPNVNSTTMPTYYLTPSPPHRHRSHSTSHSRSHSAHRHEQPIVYASSSPHRNSSSSRHGYSHSYGGHSPYVSSSHEHSNTAHYDTGSGRRRHHSMSGGHSGAYYTPIAPAYMPTAPAYTPTAPAYMSTAPAYTSTAPAYTSSSGHRRRSHSTSRHHAPQVIDVRHHSNTYGDTGRRHHTNPAEPTVVERIRRFFSVSPSRHDSHLTHSSHHAEYYDPRTGRPCTREGRPIRKF